MTRPLLFLSLLVAALFLIAVPVQGEKTASPSGSPESAPFIESLTDTERRWLHDHPVIRVFQDPGWPPVEFIDEHGKASGMSTDYLNIIERKLQVRFERIRGLTWQQGFERMKQWDIDMTTSVAQTPERTKFWAFTRPYLTVPIVIATHQQVTYIGNMNELAGRKVAVVDGYAVSEWLAGDFPEIQLVRVRTAEEGLGILKQGKVFAFIDNMLIIGYYQAKMKARDIKIAGETPYVNAQSMAVRKDWNILAVILQKALDDIPEKDRYSIYRKWLPIHYEHGPDYSLLWKVLAIFSVILLWLILWNRKLFREIRSRKEAESALRTSEQRFRQFFDVAAVPMALVSGDGAVHVLNERFVRTFGYTLDQISTVDRWFDTVFPEPDYRHHVMEVWEQALSSAISEKRDITSLECRVTCRNGDVLTVIVSGTIIGTGILVAFYDISERKKAEERLTRSLEEKEALLRELYHRTNNNMQVIRSMLLLRTARYQNPEIAVFVRDIEQGIMTMALVHQMLYQSQDLSCIDLGTYLSELTSSLIQNLNKNITFVHEVEPVSVLIDSAIPCGLVVNELVSNALKHAFPDGHSGEIRMMVRRRPEGLIEIVIADNGKGAGEGFDCRKQSSMGLQTVIALVEKQLKGTIACEPNHGFSYTIAFHDNLYTERV